MNIPNKKTHFTIFLILRKYVVCGGWGEGNVSAAGAFRTKGKAKIYRRPTRTYIYRQLYCLMGYRSLVSNTVTAVSDESADSISADDGRSSPLTELSTNLKNLHGVT